MIPSISISPRADDLKAPDGRQFALGGKPSHAETIR